MIDPNEIEFTEEIIRDGSYASDFKFERSNLRELLTVLDELSFIDMIDIGPGTGIGTEKPVPEPSSEEHLQMASETVTDTDVTALVLPSIAGDRERDMIASYTNTLDLLRIGVDADDVSAATDHLEAYRDLDMRLSLNLLKTYLITPSEAVEAAKMATEYGVEVVYVVDSAGGLSPEEVTEYVSMIQRTVDIEVGFHGHDNLGNGVQNTVTAIDAGATHVDASFQGIGRSAGNVQSELVCVQFKEGVPRRDWELMVEMESILEDVYPDKKGVAVRDVLYGLAKFHSSFESDLREFAKEQHDSFLDVLVFAARNGCATIEELKQAY